MDGTTLDREDVRQASLRLPDRQRVALELHDRKGLSYEQVATSLGVGAGAVAQLIARARINLYDELRGTALASIAAPSADCERALPLIAAREDGELESSSEDAAWLDAHLTGCERCRLAVEQMGEAAASYRAAVSRPEPPATPPSSPDGRGRKRRHAALAATALAALALGGLVAVMAGDGGAPRADRPAAATGAVQRLSDARPVRRAKERRDAAKRASKSGDRPAAETAPASAAGSASTPVTTFTPEASGGAQSGAAAGDGGSSGKAAVQPTRQTSTSKPSPTSTQASQPAPQPTSESTSTPPPTEETTPPAEEPTPEHGHKGEPPGKPTDRPPQK